MTFIDFDTRYLTGNIASVVLRDLDLLVQGQIFEMAGVTMTPLE